MKLRPDKPSTDQPRSVVAIGDNWRVKRNSLALKYHLQLFRGRQRGLDQWEDVAVETHRDDIIVAMKRHRILDAEAKTMVSKIPAWVGAGAGQDTSSQAYENSDATSFHTETRLQNRPHTGASFLSAASMRACILAPVGLVTVDRPIQSETRRASQ